MKNIFTAFFLLSICQSLHAMSDCHSNDSDHETEIGFGFAGYDHVSVKPKATQSRLDVINNSIRDLRTSCDKNQQIASVRIKLLIALKNKLDWVLNEDYEKDKDLIFILQRAKERLVQRSYCFCLPVYEYTNNFPLINNYEDKIFNRLQALEKNELPLNSQNLKLISQQAISKEER